MSEDRILPEGWEHRLGDSLSRADALRVLNGSKYVVEWGQRYPEQANMLFSSGDLAQCYPDNAYNNRLSLTLNEVMTEQSLHHCLRQFRHREMVRIIWRDLAGLADLAETMRDLSALADACIKQALILLHSWLKADFGEPENAQGEPQELIVIGMGKLGAGELNLSSDIDLIFAYPEQGQTQGGRRQLSNEEFFVRLGRKLIQALDNVTVDGFVFRVDMRLRPFGDSGTLALSFDAMEDYYQTQGREWERYALIKARPITGKKEAQQTLMSLLRPFVYRRYLDYGVFASLRELKAMIAGQLHKRGMEDNIKLGAGGIREIEFIGQVFQLIYGGRDSELQQRPILTILALLQARHLLTPQAIADLTCAYDFLRRTEHRIQAWADQQTHILPSSDEGRQRIATLMNFDCWTDFEGQLQQHRAHVQSHFEQLLTAPQAELDDAQVSLFSSPEDLKINYLDELGYQTPEAALAKITSLLESHNCRNLTETGRERLIKFLPLIVQAVGQSLSPDETLHRLIPFIESIMRRSAYMSLLVENPSALSQLIKLAAASAWICQFITKHPILLDELLDARTLYQVHEHDEQVQRLDQLLNALDDEDLEQQMDTLREFRQVISLHIAAADISNLLPVTQVGDYLSQLAELILERAVGLAWQHLVKKHGKPHGVGNTQADSGFVVVAYGKLGGRELGYGSDLDLVFLHREASAESMTDGDKPVGNMTFYTRLAQRIIHIMNTLMPSGILYEVDMRLRPNGNSGLLVTTPTGFAEYQRTEAWTWEHQALVRARCVVGDAQLHAEFNQIRSEILMKNRDHSVLALEVSEMRAKMRSQLDKSTEQLFDLKQGVGGITDIEFMVQYAVLAWSASTSELLNMTDNIRILDALKQTGKLNHQDADVLADAYRSYRQQANHCVLQEAPALVPYDVVATYQQKVIALWQKWFSEH